MTTKNLFDETARNLVTQHAFSPYETCVSAIVEALENSRDDVIEECAKVAEADDSFMMLQDFGLQTAMTQKSQNIALAIRALKATPSEAGLKSEAQRSDEVDPAGDAASLTQKLISTHRQLAVSSQDADTAKLHYDTVDEIARLQTDLASAERLAEFYQTELERILKEGTRK